MARYSRTLTPAAQAAFLAALRGGALVGAAAAEAGVAVSTLYCRRKRDAGFDSAWTAAAEASFGFAWRTQGKRRGRRLRVPTKRRVRFGATRRGLYLASLGRSCDTRASARWAGVWPSTVYRNLKRDPAFALDNRAALERGYVRLEREAALQRERRAERLRRLAERGFEPTGEPTRDFEAQMRLLDRYRRPERPGGRPALSRAESVAALERKLRHLDLGGWDASGPSP